MGAQNRRSKTENLVIGAIFTALVIVFQLLGTYTAFFGPFATAVALIPIAIGAIMCGPGIGAWLGFVFGCVVLFSGGANLFFAFDVPGTIVTVLIKGTACGFAAGWVYKALAGWNRTVATVLAALTCPIVNTLLFIAGCAVFFLDSALKIAEAIGSADTGMAIFIAMAFGNFLFELASNIILSPIIVRLLNIKNK